MRTFLILSALLCTACDGVIDDDNGCPYSAEELHVAAATLELDWLQQLGESIVNKTDGIRTQCFAASGTSTLAGQTVSSGEVWIVSEIDSTPLALESTAFRHELIHAVRWRVSDDPDASHSGPWWVLE